jgi:hypothetical protein
MKRKKRRRNPECHAIVQTNEYYPRNIPPKTWGFSILRVFLLYPLEKESEFNLNLLRVFHTCMYCTLSPGKRLLILVAVCINNLALIKSFL